MLRQVETQNGPITYELTYKKVKNLNLRLRADGSLAGKTAHGAARAAAG